MRSLVASSLNALLLSFVIDCALSAQTVTWDQLQLLSPQLQLVQTNPLSVSASSQTLQPFVRYPFHPHINSAQPLASIQYELKILQQKTPMLVRSDAVDSVAASATLPSASFALKSNTEESGAFSSESRSFASVPPVKKILHIHHYHHDRTNSELDESTTRAQERQQEKATEALVEKQVQEEVVKSLEREQQVRRDSDPHEDHFELRKSKSSETNDVEEPWKPVHKFKGTFSSQARSKSSSPTNSIEEQTGIGYHEDYAPYVHFHQRAQSGVFGRRNNPPKSDRLIEKSSHLSQTAIDKQTKDQSSEPKDHFFDEKRKPSSKPSHARSRRPMSTHKRSTTTPSSTDLDDDEPISFPEKRPRERQLTETGPEPMDKEPKNQDGEDEYMSRFISQPASIDSDENSSAEGNDYGFNDESDIATLDNLHSDTRQVNHKSRKQSDRKKYDSTLPPSQEHPVEARLNKPIPTPLQAQMNRDMPASTQNSLPESAHHYSLSPSIPPSKSGLKRNWLGLELITRNN